ncbi:MAG: ShlB/FhaC/HecB family hemolysin secretion/activation protein [Magnetococcales bacterium]|nr:ShlB/FhaC/HecB family hemolysin secretion/activation protein [Magnetococcales bacterium]
MSRSSLKKKNPIRFLLVLQSIGLLLFQTSAYCTEKNEPPPLKHKVPTDAPFLLPPVPHHNQDQGNLATQEEMIIRNIKVLNGSVFPDSMIQEITTPYTNRAVSVDELFELRDQLTRLYIKHGYVTSGLVMKDQDITDGQLVLEVVEGQLTKINISGNKALNTDFLNDYISYQLKSPLNIHELESRLQLLRQREMIRSIKSELRPELKTGEAALDLEIEEESPYFAKISHHNHNSPNLGAEKTDIALGTRSLFGRDDKLTLSYGNSQGINDYSISYEIPLFPDDTSLTLFRSRTTSSVIAEPFAALDIISRSENYGMTLTHPLIKKPNQELAASLGVQRRSSRSSLLGEPFDFTSGTTQGRSEVATIHLGQEWIVRGTGHALAIHSEFSKGVDCCGAILLPGSPNGRFLAWLGQTQWLHSLPDFWDSLVLIKGALRLTDSPMLTTEKFSLGGADTVRGYRENYLGRDQGALASIEWRIPTTLSLPVPGIQELSSYGGVTGALFYDHGYAKDKAELASTTPKEISSVGMGLLWSLSKKSNAELYLAHRLRDIPDLPNEGAQDHGIHFRMTMATD